MSLQDKKFECNTSIGFDEFYEELVRTKDVKESVKELLKWLNNDRTMAHEVSDKYEHYIHKAHLRRKIKQVFGEEFTK